MPQPSVLWLVEHVAREMDATCATATLLQRRYGIESEIYHVYGDAARLLRQAGPDIVVYPFFYQTDALALSDYVAAWPESVHFNMAWEQVHYPMHQHSKAPGDVFTRETVLHNAWGEFYQRYLEQHGVRSGNIFVNGNSAYGLYREPYARFFPSRADLAARHGLNLHKRWVFVPENYRWAFLSDKRLQAFATQGGDAAEAFALREFSLRSLEMLLGWCADLAGHSDFEVIFRTRPATNHEHMKAFAARVLKGQGASLRFIKEGSVREWVLASDVVLSSYSTTLIEASVAGRCALMAQPEPIPPSLWCDWYGLVPTVRSSEECLRACQNAGPLPVALRDWATRELLADGDPISRLADTLARLWTERRTISRTHTGPAVTLPMKEYLNPLTHDHDAFDQLQVRQRLARWRDVLQAHA